jgi:hypothetical protein
MYKYILRAHQSEKVNVLVMEGTNLIQPTISLEMPVPSQGHYGFHSFPVVD